MLVIVQINLLMKWRLISGEGKIGGTGVIDGEALALEGSLPILDYKMVVGSWYMLG